VKNRVGKLVTNGIDIIKPHEIEKRSFEIIDGILGERKFKEHDDKVIKRVIHTSADFEYADTMRISDGAVLGGVKAIRSGIGIVTDTRMAWSGINKRALEKHGSSVACFIDDPDIAREAVEKGVTRSLLCMDRAVKDENTGIFVIGNAPTALMRLCALIRSGAVSPRLVVGVPVGFVNVVESKEMLMELDIPYIVAEGRKGGSNIAAAIINAITYMADDEGIK
jgi:precorrin-8X/cobalt-precorrin-8 methylmutase